MKVQRYLLATQGRGLHKDDCGDGVRFEDYAALEAQRAGMERERDELKGMDRTQCPNCNNCIRDLREDKARLTSEIEALMDKLTVARRSMDSILCLAVEGPDGFGSALKACQAIQKEASLALSYINPKVQP